MITVAAVRVPTIPGEDHDVTLTVKEPERVTVPCINVAVISVVPTLCGFNRPLVLGDELLMMCATVSFEEVQLQLLVTFCTEPSENTAVATNGNSFTVVDTEIGGIGVVVGKTVETISPVNVALVTVTVVEADNPFCVAVMVVVPVIKPVTKPVGSTVAEPEEVQLNEGALRICVVPSENVPVAIS